MEKCGRVQRRGTEIEPALNSFGRLQRCQPQLSLVDDSQELGNADVAPSHDSKQVSTAFLS